MTAKPITIWRIATETPVYKANDSTGTGAKKTGGRWNHKGTPLVYCSPSIALACLETVVHANLGAGLPLNRYIVSITIPKNIWSAATIITSATAPGAWDALAAGRASMDYGTNWANSNSSALLFVPSVIIPMEFNVLINPLHKDAGLISFSTGQKFLYDPRFVI